MILVRTTLNLGEQMKIYLQVLTSLLKDKMLHKHKKSDLRKRSLRRKKIGGQCDEKRFQNDGRRRNSPPTITPSAL